MASSHVVDGDKIRRVELKARALLSLGAGAELPIFHVFVTDLNGIWTQQTIQNANKTDYGNGYDKKITQLAMHIGSDFEKLAAFAREVG